MSRAGRTLRANSDEQGSRANGSAPGRPGPLRRATCVLRCHNAAARPDRGRAATLPGVSRRPSRRRDAAPMPAMRRDRHGRGVRGPLAPAGTPLARSRADRFDQLVIDAVDRLNRRWHEQLAAVEFAVEDVPAMDEWDREWVPLARVFAAAGALPARVVVYRRPVETRAQAPRQLRLLLSDVVTQQVAELLGVAPEEVDPAYGTERDD